MEEIENKEELEPLHTDQLQDIIGTPPIWLYRWGITLVLSITLLCTLCSCFIQYPEVVKTKLKIISATRPITISVRDSATLLKVEVQNNQKIKKGQLLAIVKSGKDKIIVTASNDGILTYAGIIRENELLKRGQPIFIITTLSKDFYGEMAIPSFYANRVKPGQTVMVKPNNYLGEEQDMLQGKIKYVTNNIFKSGEYIAEVDFQFALQNNQQTGVMFQTGDMADADIITVPSTMFERIAHSLLKGIK